MPGATVPMFGVGRRRRLYRLLGHGCIRQPPIGRLSGAGSLPGYPQLGLARCVCEDGRQGRAVSGECAVR